MTWQTASNHTHTLLKHGNCSLCCRTPKISLEREGIHILSVVHALKTTKGTVRGKKLKRLDEIPVTSYKEEERIVSFTMAFFCAVNTYCILTTSPQSSVSFSGPGTEKCPKSTFAARLYNNSQRENNP